MGHVARMEQICISQTLVDNIKVNLKAIRYKCIDLIKLAQGKF
jgi:hypothetical protein